MQCKVKSVLDLGQNAKVVVRRERKLFDTEKKDFDAAGARESRRLPGGTVRTAQCLSW